MFNMQQVTADVVTLGEEIRSAKGERNRKLKPVGRGRLSRGCAAGSVSVVVQRQLSPFATVGYKQLLPCTIQHDPGDSWGIGHTGSS